MSTKRPPIPPFAPGSRITVSRRTQGSDPAKGYGSNASLPDDEDDLATVEILMLKGDHRPDSIMKRAGLSSRDDAVSLMTRVHAKWRERGSTTDLRLVRGETLAMYDKIEEMTWDTMTRARDHKVKLVGARTLADLRKQRLDLLGYTPRIAEQIALKGSDTTLAFNKRLVAHDKMTAIAGTLLRLMEERLDLIDDDAGQVIESAPSENA